MYEVSKYFLENGLRRSLVRAIQENLNLKDPNVIKGIDNSLLNSFRKVQQEAVHVDQADDGDKTINLNLVL